MKKQKEMKSKDLKSEYDAKILVIGEDSNLVWSEEVPNYVMFAEYFSLCGIYYVALNYY